VIYRGDHADLYSRVKWTRMDKQEKGQLDNEDEEEEKEEEETNGDVLTGTIDTTKTAV